MRFTGGDCLPCDIKHAVWTDSTAQSIGRSAIIICTPHSNALTLQAVKRRQLRQKHSKAVLPPAFNAFMQAVQNLIADIRHIMQGTQFKPN